MEFRNELAYGEYWYPRDWVRENNLDDIATQVILNSVEALVDNLEEQFTGATDYPRYLKEDIEAIDKSQEP
ncbi:hypothetical protein [Nocardia nova]|uniref:hypothetical protein n=1 Tax=Nocardia nova TaxID=37330 RepID=UPI0027394FD5|nr:hypothetical protein [Nocardia nova]